MLVFYISRNEFKLSMPDGECSRVIDRREMRKICKERRWHWPPEDLLEVHR